MFDISFGELALIGVVSLVVLGPERLPKVARTAGHLMGRLQRYVSDVKADINREMQMEELKKLQESMQNSAREVEASLGAEMRAAESSLQDGAQTISQALESSNPLLEPATLGEPAEAPQIHTETMPASESAQAQLELAIDPPKDKAGV